MKLNRRTVRIAVAVPLLLLLGAQGVQASTAAPAAPRQAAVSTSMTTEVYTGINPCRILDTRNPDLPMTGTVRVFDTHGPLAGQGGSNSCGIPDHASSIAVNLTGITTSAGGFLRGWAADDPAPSATLLNYDPVMNASNQVTIPLCRTSACAGQFKLKNYGSDMDVVGDVVGYYTPTLFASVRSTGDLNASSGAASAQQVGTGIYEVTFGQDVTACGATVSALDGNTFMHASPRFVTGQPTKVRVVIKDASGAFVDDGFHLHVAC